MTDLKKVIDEIRDLPALPDVVAKLNRMIRDPNTSANDINEVISRDVALSAKMLKLVNSPFYGFPRRITTITYAVVILGFNAVRNLALSAFVFDAFRKGDPTFDPTAFWQHSVGTAAAAQILAKKAGFTQVEDAFMGGLLHDVGKILMAQFLKPDFLKVIRETQAKDALFYDLEKAMLDYDHAEIGGLLMERWNLPPHLVEIVRFHMTPDAVPATDERGEIVRKLTDIVHFADILARALCFGHPGDDKIPLLSSGTWTRLGWKWEEVGSLMDQILDEYKRARTLFELS